MSRLEIIKLHQEIANLLSLKKYFWATGKDEGYKNIPNKYIVLIAEMSSVKNIKMEKLTSFNISFS